MVPRFAKNIILAGICVLFLALSFPAGAGYDDDFTRAGDLDNYPGITSLQSAQLIINLTSVIHQENLQILQTLHNLEDRLDKLEASVKVIEQLVTKGSR